MRADVGERERDRLAGIHGIQRCHGSASGDFLAGEQNGFFVGVSRASDVTQQRGEIDIGAFRRAQAEAWLTTSR
jgi:hypothetical protein